MPNQKIFVSYSRSDSAEVIKLASRLKQAGADLWLDQLDIPIGAVWDIEIEKALTNCECLVYIVSQASVNSNNVLNEVYYALEENKRVLPVKINECKIPFRIMRLQYIDLVPNYEAGFTQLLGSLQLSEVRLPPENPARSINPSTEEADWQKAAVQNTTSAYEGYLRSYPDGGFKSDALSALEKIHQATIKREKALKAEKEEMDWQKAVIQNNIAAYEEYLQSYVEGKYKSDALAALQNIHQAKIEKERVLKAEKEEMEWRKATQTNTLRSFQNYLQQYPSGQYAAKAQQFIKVLEKKTAPPPENKYQPESEKVKAGNLYSPYGPSPKDNPPKKIEPVVIWSIAGLVVLIIIFLTLNKSNHSDSIVTSSDTARAYMDTVVTASPENIKQMADSAAAAVPMDSLKK